MGRQKLDGALRQRRANGERHVGGVPDFEQSRRHQPGQALAAVCGVEGNAVPAAFDELGVGFREPLRGADDAVLEGAALDIARPVQRRQDIRGQLAGFLQDGVHQVRRRLLAARQPGDVAEPRQFVQHEPHFGQGCPIVGHGRWSSTGLKAVRPTQHQRKGSVQGSGRPGRFGAVPGRYEAVEAPALGTEFSKHRIREFDERNREPNLRIREKECAAAPASFSGHRGCDRVSPWLYGSENEFPWRLFWAY